MKVRLFIGTSPNSEDREIEMIYEYSLKKNTDCDLEITWMRLSNNKKDFWGGWNTKSWFTPFSGFRWSIPEYCNFEGRAIYTDVDMINLFDISQLFSVDMKGCPIAARKGLRWSYEYCVMVFDCKKAQDHIWPLKKLKSNHKSHSFHKEYFNHSSLVAEIDPSWNCLDGEDKEINQIKQFHFTNMQSQPWHPSWYKGEPLPHPRNDILKVYESLKLEALENGFKLKEFPKQKVKYKIKF